MTEGKHRVITAFLNDFQSNENVRSVVLTSSRARNDDSVDMLSDYDIEIFVRDLGPYLSITESAVSAENQDPADAWFEEKSALLVKWPLVPEAEDHWLTRLVQYRDGLRIDFQICDLPLHYHATFDAGYRVLIDKDDIARTLPKANGAALYIHRPTPERFARRINAFLWDCLYVPKALRRGEEFFAFTMLADLHFRFLREMLEWHIGAGHGWSVSSNKAGRWFRRFLEPELYARVISLIDGGAGTDHWDTWTKTMELMEEIAGPLAQAVGAAFPAEQYRAVLEFGQSLQDAPLE
jgi:aminoglycoside 6-adenylyltransferase